jgi:subtilisin family serine protease
MAKLRWAAGLLLLQMLVALVLPVPGSAQGTPTQVPEDALQEILRGKEGDATFIVRMVADPVVAYDGGVQGIPATRPGKGQKINPNSDNVRRYVAYLQQEHNRVLRAVQAGNTKLYDYTYTYNGFSAVLTPAQAAAIAAMPDVIEVAPEEVRQLQTDSSPDFLGLTAPGGLWEQLGGQGAAGEDVVVGVLDTGIWPEHPSFAEDGYGPPPADWFGGCTSGEQFSQNDCNNKLIGARFYRLGMGQGTALVDPDEYLSPRDRDGHGTHTASTAAGNADVPAEILGIDRGVISGIAPRARIAAYKVCWNQAGCFLSDIVAAIDGAVAEGVDVINYSIGGGASLLGEDDVAFLFAADAGIFVSTSAGNSGPDGETVGGPATVPWITAVGASTQARTFQGSVELGNGNVYSGATVTAGTDTLPIVDSANAGSELCIVGELDPAVVTGKIVLCMRGENARVAKSQAVFEAGGAGMVLYNTNDTEDVLTDNHWVPSVHLSFTDGTAVKNYIAAEEAGGFTPVAQIVGGEFTAIPAPDMAAFSSRGPNPVAADIIKPDVTAPGVVILAGGSPNPFLGSPDELFQAISGTSMASPHVAGLYALLKQQHPDWTPAMAKSAIMTSAYQDVEKEDGVTQADPFDMGAGHIQPNTAGDPGLVYDAGFIEYLQFLCGVGALSATSGTCTAVGAVDPSDLNLASIGVAELAGVQTVTRTVTSVTPGDATYSVSVEAPPGVDVQVTPNVLTLSEGQSATYEVTFTTLSGAVADEWVFGALTWSDGTHNVRSPLAIRPVALAAPDEVSGDGTSGSLSYDITFGFSGDFAAVAHGLIPAATQPGNVVDDPANDINVALSTGVGVTFHIVSVPAGTEYLRVSLFDEYTDGADDLDLYVFGPGPGFPFVGGSGTATSAEEVNVAGPAPGDYLVAVHGWQTDGPDANYTLFSWSLGDANEGNLSVSAPGTAVLGTSAPVDVDWTGLDGGHKYLGSVTYHDVASPAGYTDGLVDYTIVRIDTD